MSSALGFSGPGCAVRGVTRLAPAAALGILLAATPAWGHPPDEQGRHASHPAGVGSVRLWTNARTGEAVKGAFLIARTVEGETWVSIERDNGDVVVFALADLAEADRVEAQRRMDRARSINGQAIAGTLFAPDGQPAQAGDRPAQALPFDLFAPHVRTRWDARWLYVESDGLPYTPGAKGAGGYAYPLMVGIKSWQQQVPLPQAYTGDNAWRIPLKPELADRPVSGTTALYRGAIALAANGVPIFNALNNRGDDTYKVGELDEYGGHCGRADDYHYHIAPLALQKIVGSDKPIAYALDGFPLYGLFDPAAKRGEEKACPLGATDPLDELNGHFGALPPGSPPGTTGLYHYHASLAYPYINGGVRGKVTVKDDQIDPQPRANPVRPWLQPLRGAAITGFRTLAEKSWSLEYTLAGRKHLVNFRIEGAGPDAQYIFDFIDPDGARKTETYQARAPREGRPPRDRPDGGGRGGGGGGGGGGGRGDRPPRGDGAPPRPPPGGAPAEPAAAPISRPMEGFVITSPDVIGGRLSVECTCDGKSRSPALAWCAGREPPQGTKAFAVVMHHVPPEGGAHVYMVVANIPAEARELKSGDLTRGTWGQNTVNRRSEYAPPCSRGPGDKVYTITIYALSAETTLPNDKALTRDALLSAIKDTTLATATLDVKYARPGAGGEGGR